MDETNADLKRKENGKRRNQFQFGRAVRMGLSRRFAIYMRMNNSRPVNDMAMIEKTDIRIVECENRNQNQGCYPFTSLRHYNVFY
jgi:hypothetical protein